LRWLPHGCGSTFSRRNNRYTLVEGSQVARFSRAFGRSLGPIGPTGFFSNRQTGAGGLPAIPEGEGVTPTNDRDRSVRPIMKYDRSDHLVSAEASVETKVSELEKKRPPRPIPEIDRSDRFFFGPVNGGRGATGFFGGGGLVGNM
jgi:hypothetical protein